MVGSPLGMAHFKAKRGGCETCPDEVIVALFDRSLDAWVDASAFFLHHGRTIGFVADGCDFA